MCVSYRADSAEQTTVAEEDDQQWDGEMQDEHVDDKRGVVDFRFGSVVIYSAGALHSLRNIPAHTHIQFITAVCLLGHCPVRIHEWTLRFYGLGKFS